MKNITFEKGELRDYKPLRNQNYISTTLYHFYNFLPLALFNQVRKFSNIYFIIVAALSCVPQFASVTPASAIFPVVFVIVFSMVFDLYEDFRRYLRDRALNHKLIKVFRDGKWQEQPSKSVQPGDLIMVTANEEICADLLLLTFRSTAPYAYIETANLDGEKNLKPKIAVFDKFLTEAQLFQQFNLIEITYRPNEESLERFEGFIKYQSERLVETESKISIHNFLPRSCMIRNTTDVIGVALYTGHETKIMKNTKLRIFKTSTVEKKMNKYILVIVVIQVLLLVFMALYSILIRQIHGDFILHYFPQEHNYGVEFIYTLLAYFIILSTVLPISLIITLQAVKTLQKLFFILERRKAESQISINAFTINEELGQIEYVLSDKTGTLTQNKMILRHFQVLGKTFNFFEAASSEHDRDFDEFKLQSVDQTVTWDFKVESDMEQLFFVLVNTCHECFSQMRADETEDTARTQSNQYKVSKRFISMDWMKKFKRPKAGSEVSFINTPLASQRDIPRGNYDEMKLNTEIQGPSPDEIALLRGSKDFCGYLFKGSTLSESIVFTSDDRDVIVRTLLVNKFDSMRKMMSTVVEYEGRIMLFAKGADNVIGAKLRKQKTQQDIDTEDVVHGQMNDFVKEGYRILLFAVRILSTQEWSNIQNALREANGLGERADEATNDVLKQLECELQLIGASAIEDKLQNNLRESIIQIRKANIKMWVITGDKLETAENIAISSGLFDTDMPIRHIKNIETMDDVDVEPRANLLVEGDLFGQLVKENGAEFQRFKLIIMQYDCVVFCRTNANQKVEIVRIVKSFGRITLAIGDGANDVNMIQEANVGVGIYGEEGKQASNASDFSIERFEFLTELIFSHGRLSYYRISQMVLYFYYKNFIFTLVQFLFGFFDVFSRATIFPDWYISFYNLLFTSLAVGMRAIFDKDLKGFGQNTRTLEIYTYFYGKENKLFNGKKFALWLICALFEGCALFFFIYFAYVSKAYYNFHETNYDVFSMLLFTSLVVHITLKLIYLTNIFTLLQYIAYASGILIYVLYFIITNYTQDYGLYYANTYTWGVISYWINLFFCNFFLIFFTIAYYKGKEIIYPNVKRRAYQTVGKKFDPELESKVQRWVAREQSYSGPMASLYN